MQGPEFKALVLHNPHSDTERCLLLMLQAQNTEEVGLYPLRQILWKLPVYYQHQSIRPFSFFKSNT